MGVQITTVDPFAAPPDAPAADPGMSASASSSGAGSKGKTGKAEMPASARDEVMRVLFADRGGEGFDQAVRQVGTQLRQKAREQREPFYREAFNQGAEGFESPELDKMAASPLFARAMQRAETTLQDRQAVPGIEVTGVRGAKGRTLEYWDQVGQRLDDMSEAAKRAGADDKVKEIDGMRKSLRSQLDKAFSQYETTRGPAELFFDAADPVEAGAKFANGRYPLVKAQQVISIMGADEKKLFAEGFAKAFTDMVRSAPDRRAVLDRMKLLEGEQNKVRLALGGRADQLEAFLRLEGLINAAPSTDPSKSITDLMVRGSAMTETPLHRGVAEQIARKLISRNPDVFLDGLKQASKSEVLEGLRAIGVAEGAPQQGSQAPGVDRVYQKARDAIAQGADRTAVMKRLSDNGMNPRGL